MCRGRCLTGWYSDLTEDEYHEISNAGELLNELANALRDEFRAKHPTWDIEVEEAWGCDPPRRKMPRKGKRPSRLTEMELRDED